MDLENIPFRLNEEQKKAVLDNSKACLVNANVGSGKTTVLISKIMYLHKVKNIEFKDMIVLTFTNKAANEIKERLIEYDPSIDEKEIAFFGTFHSVALKLLQSNLDVESLGYIGEFSVIDPDEEMEMATTIIADNSLNIKYKNKLIKRIDLANQGIYTFSAMRVEDDIKELLRVLQYQKQKQGKMSFNDLINNATELIKNKPDLAKWIFIDEFQDCNSKQLEFIHNIVGLKTQLFAVGDPNQVIYTWRGSSQNVFEKFKSEYNALELSLPLNYRSCSTIIEVAKCFLSKNTDLRGTREHGNKIIVKSHYNSFNEAEYLKDSINLLVRNGVTYNEIAIFYRLQRQSKVLEDVFQKNEIPFEVSMRKTLKDIPVLRWLIKLLKYSINLSDTGNGMLVLSDKLFGDSLTTIESKKIIETRELGKSKLFDKILGFRKWCDLNRAPNKIYDYFEIDDYITPTAINYSENKDMVNILLNNLAEYIRLKNILLIQGITEFINSSALYGVDILKEDVHIENNTIKLMTLHSSKGLEFKYVFIIGVNFGYIPMWSNSIEEQEEEQRLFFVGITRAKDFLEISYYTSQEDQRVVAGASRYISMIPKKLIVNESSKIIEKLSLHDLRKEVEKSKHESLKHINAPDIDTMNTHRAQNEAKVNKNVSHPKYGIGEVLNENEMIIVVKFEGFGEKEFVKGFSELKNIDGSIQ